MDSYGFLPLVGLVGIELWAWMAEALYPPLAQVHFKGFICHWPFEYNDVDFEARRAYLFL